MVCKSNCKNCGAPLNPNGDCEYCGTKRQIRPRSIIEVTASSIRLFADDHCVDEEDERERH